MLYIFNTYMLERSVASNEIRNTRKNVSSYKLKFYRNNKNG